MFEPEAKSMARGWNIRIMMIIGDESLSPSIKLFHLWLNCVLCVSCVQSPTQHLYYYYKSSLISDPNTLLYLIQQQLLANHVFIFLATEMANQIYTQQHMRICLKSNRNTRIYEVKLICMYAYISRFFLVCFQVLCFLVVFWFFMSYFWVFIVFSELTCFLFFIIDKIKLLPKNV